MSEQTRSYIQKILQDAFLMRVSDLRLSTNLAKEALEISRELEDDVLIGTSLNQLALYYMIQGEYEQCLKLSGESIAVHQRLGDEKGVADAKYSIASIYYKTDNYQLGLINLIECLGIYRKYNDFHNQARTLKSLGTIYEYFGDEKNAIKSYEQSIEAAKVAEDKNLESNAYNPLSGIYLNQNKIEDAFDTIQKSINIKRETGDIRGLAFALYGRGKVFFKLKELEKAEEDYKEAIRIHLEMNERLGIGMAYYKLAELYFYQGNFQQSFETLETAIAHSTKFNIVMIKFKCHYLMYQLYKQQDNIQDALNSLELYLKEKEQVINTQTLKIIENYELINKMEALERESEIQKERDEIIQKTHRAEQTAKMKQDFLSTMSHEIRTPLNAVITIANLLKDRSTKDENQLVSSLSFAAHNLLLIINDILDFTKLDSGKVVLEYRPQTIRCLLENIRNTYNSLAEEKQIELKLSVEEKLSQVYLVDDVKLAQILGNLISNAIKYTHQGSVNVNVSLLSKNEESDKIRFSVVDTGIGIPKEYLSEIFESFSQPKSITTKKQGGTGLGLAIVKKIIELHNSEICVESEPHKGSEFYFDLDLKVTEEKPVEIKFDEEQLKGKMVLIVDDNPINALVAKKLLSKWGVLSEHAFDGNEAVLKANQVKFDCILMDIHMPNMDGYEACDIIRSTSNINKNTSIYALTADITADLLDAEKHNFNGFLLKPIEIDKLKEALIA